MNPEIHDLTSALAQEHRALLAEYGRAQSRCSALLAAQAREIARLQAEVVRLRAAVIVRDTWLSLVSPAGLAGNATDEALDQSLEAADLVICQTGCISHNDYWRVQEHCRRTGKPCVMVDSPKAMLWLRNGESRKVPLISK